MRVTIIIHFYYISLCIYIFVYTNICNNVGVACSGGLRKRSNDSCHCYAPATLPDAATAPFGAKQRSCNSPRRCNCCLQGHATLLQRSRTLQLLLPEPRNAAALLDAATAVSWPLRRSPGETTYRSGMPSKSTYRSEMLQLRPRIDQESYR